MRKFILIAMGGVLGAVARYLIKDAHWLEGTGGIPWDTLIINVSGSFLLAWLVTFAAGWRNFDEGVKLGIATGFLGAYTTFSTLCKEIVNLLLQGRSLAAASYVSLSVALGLSAAWLGAVLAEEILTWGKKQAG